MSLLAALAAPFLKAARQPRRILALGEVGRPQWTPRDYAALAREGYGRNAVVHRCVRLVAEGVGALKPVAIAQGREVPDHPALALLARPNGHEAGPAFLETIASHLMLAGNAYVEAVRLDGKVAALQTLRPDRTRVVPGPDGWPAAYEHGAGSSLVRLGPTADGRASVLHLKLFHPTNDHYGMAPLEAAQVALDVLNAASAWNKALLDNAARPSGALVYAPASGASLSREQFERLKEELEASYQGAGNAGRPLLLEGGLDWKPLALTPRELDFVETKNAAARESRSPSACRRCCSACRGTRPTPTTRRRTAPSSGRPCCRSGSASSPSSPASSRPTSARPSFPRTSMRSRRCIRSARRCGGASNARASSPRTRNAPRWGMGRGVADARPRPKRSGEPGPATRERPRVSPPARPGTE
jgi:HK97 family phage portal protein